MTYIFGLKCRDGVVMIADKKFLMDYGSKNLYDNKIFGELRHMISAKVTKTKKKSGIKKSRKR